MLKKKEFPEADIGLVVPTRRLQIGSLRLRISNLDTSDPPPPYHDGGVPRCTQFNRKNFEITDDPYMPKIAVRCLVDGFDTKQTPILWRLQVLHVFCRYEKVKKGPYGLPQNYRDRSVTIRDAWAGESNNPDFTLFWNRDNLKESDGSDRVAGGHAILTVAAKPKGSDSWLQDYVHIRINGTNPGLDIVGDALDAMVTGRDVNLQHMLRAIFAWEARFQFSKSAQTGAHFKKLGTPFKWPPDPPNYPLTAFDFGVGYSQFTHPASLTSEIAWDWRENAKSGVNIFLQALNNAYVVGSNWNDWALRAWSAYNGVRKKNGITAYGKRLGRSPEGQKVSAGLVPKNLDLQAFTKTIPTRPVLPEPKWPVTGLPMIFETEDIFATLEEAGWDEVTDIEVAAFDPPKAVPTSDPFAFATSSVPKNLRHWPVLTTNPSRLLVSYTTQTSHVIGKFDRQFLARRQVKKEGTFKRYHVGIDLFAKRRDVVVACEDGVIVAFYAFYPAATKRMTYALLIEHGSFVVNYGEVTVDAPSEFHWRVGDHVVAGQHIARISDTAMLHFETYKKGVHRNEHYYPKGKKPKDLLNPTEYLLEVAESGFK